MSRLISFSVIALFVLMSQLTLAQQHRWANLEQIQTGQKVIVIGHDLKTQTGTFVRYSETNLTIKAKDKEIVIDRDRVYRVTTGPQHRGRNALIGLGIGTAAGAALAVGATHTVEDVSAGDAAGVVAGIAGIGTGVGALIAPAKTIYRAEKRVKTPATAGQ